MSDQPGNGSVDNKVICESCGARNSVPQGDGSYICQSCGWVQHDPIGTKAKTAPIKRRMWPALVILVALIAGAVIAWRHLHHHALSDTKVASSSAPATAAVATPNGNGNRQVTVQHPKIRVIDEGLDWTLDELFAPQLPLFDRSKLELGTFERIIDETGLPTFRAPLNNRSTDAIVINPVMDLRLYSTDGTSQVPASIGGLPPSLYPGEKAWVKIGDDDDIKPIARMDVHWHPSRGLSLPGPRRKANLEVKSQQMRTCHERIINGQGDFSFNYQCVDMVGTLHNTDTRSMKLIGVAVTYYDDDNRYVGSDSTDLNTILQPGDQVDFELHTKLLRKHGYKRFELQYYNQ
ncbi:FxLYD domain-containing protein [Rhodanobacter sp. L36]|uniref:FxLYD domain-containing protein n=1 Tax=Rhodanobacter sp. L36 TaxID=1747221 RepID=UPI00131CFB0E|nr:FxLYD domain-containing protein [Rhodanobacter sp. L36]